MNRIPHWLRTAAQMIAACLISYLAVAFVRADLSIFAWPMDVRLATLALSALIFWVFFLADTLSDLAL